MSIIPWSKSVITSSQTLVLPYTSLLSSDDTLLQAASQLTSYGILFITGVPHEETSEERSEVIRLATRLGRIRETFYGRTWDVQSRGAASRNVAYTNLNLGLHSDLQYFENPPRYQVLVMLRNRGVKGGASIFSDAFHAAYELQREDRRAFDTLSTQPVAFQYQNDNHHLYREHPTIELASQGSHLYGTRGEGEPVVHHINYSPPFQAPLPLATAQNPHFLSAFKRFTSILESPEALYEYPLKEGDAVIFDNRRVLHGRREFTNASEKEWTDVNVEEGTRWLKGTYIEPEGVLDQLNTLKDRVNAK